MKGAWSNAKMAAVCKSVAGSVPFHDFCSLLERVSVSRGTDKKKKLISAFLEQWRSAHRALHSGDAASAVSGWPTHDHAVLHTIARRVRALQSGELASDIV